MCIISNSNEDCLTLITRFLTPEEIIHLCLSNRSYRLFLINQEIIWKSLVPLSKPSWISSYYNFTVKLLNKSHLACMKCDKKLSRLSVLIICDCTTILNRKYARWHRNCVLKRNNTRSVGSCLCPICNRTSMYVIATSYP